MNDVVDPYASDCFAPSMMIILIITIVIVRIYNRELILFICLLESSNLSVYGVAM